MKKRPWSENFLYSRSFLCFFCFLFFQHFISCLGIDYKYSQNHSQKISKANIYLWDFYVYAEHKIMLYIPKAIWYFSSRFLPWLADFIYQKNSEQDSNQLSNSILKPELVSSNQSIWLEIDTCNYCCFNLSNRLVFQIIHMTEPKTTAMEIHWEVDNRHIPLAESPRKNSNTKRVIPYRIP